MIHGTVEGRLDGKPELVLIEDGRLFVTVKVITSRHAEDGSPIPGVITEVVTCKQDVMDALMALEGGASVCLAGEIEPSVFARRGQPPLLGLTMWPDEIRKAVH